MAKENEAPTVETQAPEAPAQPSQESIVELHTRLAKLAKMAAEAAESGNTEALLESAGEIAALKKQIEGVQKAEKAKKLSANQEEISKLRLKMTTKFDQLYATLKADLDRLAELGDDVEVLRYTVEIADEAKTGNANRVFMVGPKSKSRTTTGSGGGGGKSSRSVTCADGTMMKTREFVDMYANDEERATKTFESWPTALADKIAKRVGATIA